MFGLQELRESFAKKYVLDCSSSGLEEIFVSEEQRAGKNYGWVKDMSVRELVIDSLTYKR